MKKDKMLQHQLKRLRKLLAMDKAKGMHWGSISPWGHRVATMYDKAIHRSLKRHVK